ncbi:hypothetical protein [Amorphus sp. 3PC139-8]|uniref:hypothetical protein n=1 Tax=Amorphus sp. 3PC139-8 TaxID=2735676 RepID=UPI00345DA075
MSNRHAQCRGGDSTYPVERIAHFTAQRAEIFDFATPHLALRDLRAVKLGHHLLRLIGPVGATIGTSGGRCEGRRKAKWLRADSARSHSHSGQSTDRFGQDKSFRIEAVT